MTDNSKKKLIAFLSILAAILMIPPTKALVSNKKENPNQSTSINKEYIEDYKVSTTSKIEETTDGITLNNTLESTTESIITDMDLPNDVDLCNLVSKINYFNEKMYKQENINYLDEEGNPLYLAYLTYENKNMDNTGNAIYECFSVGYMKDNMVFKELITGKEYKLDGFETKIFLGNLNKDFIDIIPKNSSNSLSRETLTKVLKLIVDKLNNYNLNDIPMYGRKIAFFTGNGTLFSAAITNDKYKVLNNDEYVSKHK